MRLRFEEHYTLHVYEIHEQRNFWMHHQIIEVKIIFIVKIDDFLHFTYNSLCTVTRYSEQVGEVWLLCMVTVYDQVKACPS